VLMAAKRRVLYVSGEESERQIKMRAVRLAPMAGAGNGRDSAVSLPDNLLLVTETNLEVILNHVQEVKPELLIVDSIQTVYLSELDSSAGSVTQVRECAAQLRELAKSSGISVFMIGHVTKEGAIAGPRVLEHIVDTVLYLEGDRFQAYRLLRSVKNRFGATSEVGVFEMRERGLQEVSNPSEAFLAERMINAPGSSIAVTMEGTRPILVEIQGLTSPTQFGNARRTPNGVDFNRLLLIAAVLTRRVGLKLSEQDVFVNVVGGLQIDGDRFVVARHLGAGRCGADRRDGPCGGAAHARADGGAAARGGEAGVQDGDHPAGDPAGRGVAEGDRDHPGALHPAGAGGGAGS
jgi:DNA repair protein RadA/Sms